MCNVLQKLPSSKKYGIKWKLEDREREGDPREGRKVRKEIGHEGLCILLSWTVKLVSTRPGTNQIEERYGMRRGGEGDLVERSSGEKLLDTLLATCTICSAATLDLSILFHPVFLATESERRMEDKAVATCKMLGVGGFDERRKGRELVCNSIRKN